VKENNFCRELFQRNLLSSFTSFNLQPCPAERGSAEQERSFDLAASTGHTVSAAMQGTGAEQAHAPIRRTWSLSHVCWCVWVALLCAAPDPTEGWVDVALVPRSLRLSCSVDVVTSAIRAAARADRLRPVQSCRRSVQSGAATLSAQLKLPSQIDWEERGRGGEGGGEGGGTGRPSGGWKGWRERGREVKMQGAERRYRCMQRYYEQRIYDDDQDVDALCSFACFLQVVREQNERAALMYSCALRADPKRARGIALLLAAEIRTPMDFEFFHSTIFEEIRIPRLSLTPVAVPALVKGERAVVRRFVVPKLVPSRRKRGTK
jgi:hypothetical protein